MCKKKEETVVKKKVVPEKKTEGVKEVEPVEKTKEVV